MAKKREKQKTIHARVRRQASKNYEAMLEAQDGHCALCPSVAKERRLHIDHDHKTLKVRGLLCFRCNVILRDYLTADWMRKAADYLDRSECVCGEINSRNCSVHQ